MFNCDSCGKTTQPGEKMNKVVDSERKKVYNYTKVLVENGRRKKVERQSSGSEIARESSFCEKCYGEINE